MAVAVDSDAVVGFLDRADLMHEDAARRISGAIHSDVLVASAVTFAEVLAGARLGHHPEDNVRAFFDELVRDVIPMSKEIAEASADIRARSGLRMPDCIVLASAIVDEATTELITGDKGIAKAAGKRLRVSVLRSPSG